MDVPITKPSMVSYADEINFSQLLEKLLKNRHNGFMRITSGDDEGFILFKDGKQAAAEYGRFSKSEAIENIMSAAERNDTVIEIFDLKSSHMDYLIDVNKPFIMEPDFDINKILDELKGLDNTEPLIPEKISKTANSIESLSESESVPESGSDHIPESEPAISELISNEPKKEIDSQQGTEPETVLEPEYDSKQPEIEMEATVSEPVSKPETDISEPKDSKLETVTDSKSELKPSDPETEALELKPSEGEIKTVFESESKSPEPIVSEQEEVKNDKISPESEDMTSLQDEQKTTASETSASSNQEKISDVEKTPIQPDSDTGKSAKSKDTLKDELKTMESKPQSEVESEVEVKEEPIDRSKLMEKYGIKEMNEEDVEDILDDYKGGSLNDEDVEKIELSLMNKIKKSIFGIPKIKGVEVMVFLENAVELSGDINIIIEYEAKGFFSRLIGESKDIENLRRQIINIVQIEIKKSFRKYPEIINNFNINVEIS